METKNTRVKFTLAIQGTTETPQVTYNRSPENPQIDTKKKFNAFFVQHRREKNLNNTKNGSLKYKNK